MLTQVLEEALEIARIEAATAAKQRGTDAANAQKESGMLQASAWVVALPMVQCFYFGLKLLLWALAALQRVAVWFKFI